MLQHACGLTQEQLLSGHADQLPKPAAHELNRLLTRRATREPLAYILGERDFYGRTFRVDQRVLIPRPETELLIDLCTQFVEHNQIIQPNICDIGTGSGIIAITLAKQLPNANITATDISTDALELAKINASHHEANVHFTVEDATRRENPRQLRHHRLQSPIHPNAYPRRSPTRGPRLGATTSIRWRA